jgi:hypothetical protein
MGLYDSYEGCQIKVGNPSCKSYTIGDGVSIPDGVYITYEGIVVVQDETLICVCPDNIFDKWGKPVDSYTLMKVVHYRNLAVAGIDKALKKIIGKISKRKQLE